MVSLKIVYHVCLLVLVIFLMNFGLPPTISAMESNTMKFSLERSGGFTGIPVTTTVDVDSLPTAEANQLRQLVEATDFFNYPAQITAASSLPDRFQYQITVEDNQQKHTVIVGEAAIPNNLRPLIELLLKVGHLV
jgi:hypothetical protein